MIRNAFFQKGKKIALGRKGEFGPLHIGMSSAYSPGQVAAVAFSVSALPKELVAGEKRGAHEKQQPERQAHRAAR